MPVSQQFAEASLTFDDRYAPILITRWEGRADLEASEWLFALMNEAIEAAARRGHVVVTVSDATHAKNPSADVRKYLAEHGGRILRGQRNTLVANLVVLDSALVRGALTAVGWLSDEIRTVKSFATLPPALEQAVREMDERGILPAAKLDPESYRFPPAGSTPGG